MSSEPSVDNAHAPTPSLHRYTRRCRSLCSCPCARDYAYGTPAPERNRVRSSVRSERWPASTRVDSRSDPDCIGGRRAYGHRMRQAPRRCSCTCRPRVGAGCAGIAGAGRPLVARRPSRSSPRPRQALEVRPGVPQRPRAPQKRPARVQSTDTGTVYYSRSREIHTLPSTSRLYSLLDSGGRLLQPTVCR